MTSGIEDNPSLLGTDPSNIEGNGKVFVKRFEWSLAILQAYEQPTPSFRTDEGVVVFPTRKHIK